MVEVRYRALLPQGLQVTGPDPVSPARMSAAYTYTQPEYSRTWYPCLDRPSDKATMTITVRVPEGYNALSNGVLLGRARTSGEELFRYRMDAPIATYLVSLAIGKYDVVSLGSWRGRPLTLWTPPAIRDAAVYETSRTADMMEVMSRFTGTPYPFSSYAQSIAQAWKTSMEHQTATTMGGFRIMGDRGGEGVIAHELAHQWFGDYVTCAHWGELWLNEGYATYLPYVFFKTGNDEPRALGQIDYWRSGYFGEARDRMHALSHPAPDMDNLFDSHAYEKGALTIHLMRWLANRMGSVRPDRAGLEPYSQALREYLGQRSFRTSTSEDLQRALEKVTGASWQMFFDQFVRTAGHPVFEFSLGERDGRRFLGVRQTRSTPFTLPLPLEIVSATGQVRNVVFEIYDTEHQLDLGPADEVAAVMPDPEWVLPAEWTLSQGEAAWLLVANHSPLATSRISAHRQLALLTDNLLPVSAVRLAEADRSEYLKSVVLEILTRQAANREHVLTVYRSLEAQESRNVATAGMLARTEEWLVATLGQTPGRDDERRWQERFLRSGVVAERKALLGMLKTASLERAQEFALERLNEPHWVTQDRINLVDILSKSPSPVSEAWVKNMIRTGSSSYQRQVMNNLAALAWDDAEIVEDLTDLAATHRSMGVRVSAINLLAVQKNSAGVVCPFLQGVVSGEPVIHEEIFSWVRETAANAVAKLGCQ